MRLVWGGGFTDNILLAGEKTLTVDELLEKQFPFLSPSLRLSSVQQVKKLFYAPVKERTRDQSDGDVQPLCADSWIDSKAPRGSNING